MTTKRMNLYREGEPSIDGRFIVPNCIDLGTEPIPVTYRLEDEEVPTLCGKAGVFERMASGLITGLVEVADGVLDLDRLNAHVEFTEVGYEIEDEGKRLVITKGRLSAILLDEYPWNWRGEEPRPTVQETVTPYPEPGGEGATSGWSGSETSHERAVEEDANGTTRDRQRETLWQLALYGNYGLTVKDLRTATGWHHGQASSALSVLHKEGEIARLTERRDRCAVYVLKMYVGQRETSEPGRNRGRVQRLNHTDQAVLRRVRAAMTSGPLSNTTLWNSDIEHLLTMIENTYETKDNQ